ncbi:MAG: Smr/MutS family protein [bacterium]
MIGGEDNPSDAELFRRAMQESGVRATRRKQTKISAETGKPTTKPRKVQPRRALPPPASRSVLIDQTTEGPQVLFVRAGVNKPTIKKLRNGLIRIDESIDLHGMRTHEASRALQAFLEESLEHGYVCVEIIHGKGQRSEQAGGILKPMAIHWLKQQFEVLAFCSAIPSHGGSGATTVLLDIKR